ncbi:unnamed protein product [Trifolium pratense]|uniref:Uncharacterized protein n=1 Tax=Trifolium pratense TaxID=57577 RepID=A0ACB0KDJ4_TRIPR|nr:unnamed protein product [Trifolium pratense]
MNNPYDEQKLRDEVIYLHYLWQQGPPQQPNHIPPRTLHNIPSSSSQPHYTPHFHPPLHRHPFPPSNTGFVPRVTSTAFKKRNKKRKKRERKRTEPDPPRSPGPDWPCPKLPDSPKTGWPVPKPRSDSPPSLQPQEKERLSALQLQNKACKAFREFLIDEDNEVVEDDDEEDDDDSDGRMEEFEEFFIRVFMEDNQLRGYYQRCFENGEFFCLVCGAAEKKKSGKKYKDCIGLVQHSKLIVRTGNKKAHRAFGQAVCKVLGWDIHRLPTIVTTGVPLGCSMEINPAQSLGDPKESAAADDDDDEDDDDDDDDEEEEEEEEEEKDDDDDGKDGSRKTEDIAVSLEHVKDPVEEYAKGADQSNCECSSKEGDIDANVGDIGLENGGGRFEMQGEIEEKVVSLAHDDEPVEEHEQAVDRSISEVIIL